MAIKSKKWYENQIKCLENAANVLGAQIYEPKWYGQNNLSWKSIKGKWLLHDIKGKLHECPKNRYNLNGKNTK